jgi:hypothetical protein
MKLKRLFKEATLIKTHVVVLMTISQTVNGLSMPKSMDLKMLMRFTHQLRVFAT